MQVIKPICRNIRGMMVKLMSQESVVKDTKMNLDQEKSWYQKKKFSGVVTVMNHCCVSWLLSVCWSALRILVIIPSICQLGKSRLCTEVSISGHLEMVWWVKAYYVSPLATFCTKHTAKHWGFSSEIFCSQFWLNLTLHKHARFLATQVVQVARQDLTCTSEQILI